MDLNIQSLTLDKKMPYLGSTSTTALPSVIYEPKGKLYTLDGIANNQPNITAENLERMCSETKATLLHPLIKETEDELIFYGMQSESHLLIRYDKKSKKMIIDDFTCGNTANPGEISPTINPWTNELFGLKKYSELNLKRGHKVLRGRKNLGNHLIFDIYSCCGDSINDENLIRRGMSAALNDHTHLNEILHPFNDAQGKKAGFSGMKLTPEGHMINLHSYPSDKVIMGDISSKIVKDFGPSIDSLMSTFKGRKIDYRVLHRNY